VNFIQRAIKAVFGKGTSKSALRRREANQRGFAEGTRFSGKAVSRQTRRAQLRDAQYQAADKALPRKERRRLARALAAKAWKSEAA
jgi:hypothetical protein